MPQDDSVEFEDGQKSSGKSQKSYKSFLGYQYISFAVLGRSMDSIMRWMNTNVTTDKLPLTNFPHDLIKHNGAQLFDLIYYLTNKQLAYQANLDSHMRRIQKVKPLCLIQDSAGGEAVR